MQTEFRVRFIKKIQDWILKTEEIRKQILCFFTKQINPRSFGSWCIEGTERSWIDLFSK